MICVYRTLNRTNAVYTSESSSRNTWNSNNNSNEKNIHIARSRTHQLIHYRIYRYFFSFFYLFFCLFILTGDATATYRKYQHIWTMQRFYALLSICFVYFGSFSINIGKTTSFIRFYKLFSGSGRVGK